MLRQEQGDHEWQYIDRHLEMEKRHTEAAAERSRFAIDGYAEAMRILDD